MPIKTAVGHSVIIHCCPQKVWGLVATEHREQQKRVHWQTLVQFLYWFLVTQAVQRSKFYLLKRKCCWKCLFSNERLSQRLCRSHD